MLLLCCVQWATSIQMWLAYSLMLTGLAKDDI